MSSRLRLAALLAASVGLAAAFAAPAGAQGVAVGTLTCNVASGWGFVFGSSRGLKCNYEPKPGVVEHYVGHINKYGVDIGYSQAGVIVWVVVAPTTDLAAGAIAGNYGGVTAGATVGAGLGANVLVGGSNKSIALQPLSFEGDQGLNVAAGIASINLRYKP